MATTNQIAEYNGRKYKLLYLGDTKYGLRAKLGFIDGSKEFWVDAAKVQVSNQGYQYNQRPASRPVCCECGKPGRLVRDLEDGMPKHYNCCDIPPSNDY